MMICLRCGKEMPETTVYTRKYCDKCTIERKMQSAIEREKRDARAQSDERNIEVEAENRQYCKPCIYCGVGEYSSNLCDYLLETGHIRGCKYGVGCDKRVLKEEKHDGKAH